MDLQDDGVDALFETALSDDDTSEHGEGDLGLDGGDGYGGGDIDDAPAPLDVARGMEQRLAEARELRGQWEGELRTRETALKEAQARYRDARKRALEGDASDDDEIAAQDAVLEARYALDKARDALGQADTYQRSLEQVPRLSQAQQDWLTANPRYNSDQRFARQAQQIMRDLAKEGFDANNPQFYRRLDERMRTSPRLGANARRTPGAPAVRTGERGTDEGAAGGPLNKQEAAFITGLGRNPRDPEVRKQWRQSKANTYRVAKQRGFL